MHLFILGSVFVKYRSVDVDVGHCSTVEQLVHLLDPLGRAEKVKLLRSPAGEKYAAAWAPATTAAGDQLGEGARQLQKGGRAGGRVQCALTVRVPLVSHYHPSIWLQAASNGAQDVADGPINQAVGHLHPHRLPAALQLGADAVGKVETALPVGGRLQAVQCPQNVGRRLGADWLRGDAGEGER